MSSSHTYSKYSVFDTTIQTLLYCGIALAIAQIFLRFALAFASGVGGICETSKRKHVPKLFYAHLLGIVIELPLYSSIVYFETWSETCTYQVSLRIPDSWSSKVCLFIRVVGLLAITFLLWNLFTFLVTFDSTGRAWKDTPGLWCMDIDGENALLDWHMAHKLNAQLWYRRLRCLSCFRSSFWRQQSHAKTGEQSIHGDKMTFLLVSDLVGRYFMVRTNLLHILPYWMFEFVLFEIVKKMSHVGLDSFFG